MYKKQKIYLYIILFSLLNYSLYLFKLMKKKIGLFVICNLIFVSSAFLEAKQCICGGTLKGWNAKWEISYHVPDGTGCSNISGAAGGAGGTFTVISSDGTSSSISGPSEALASVCYP
ncbi:MAG: hypothetical protein EAZ12_02130 [Sphingobacteriia bacterium]|nr:MAG: hypothetical protein EAZ12_02130 [Sphingobacteriia bacterium]